MNSLFSLLLSLALSDSPKGSFRPRHRREARRRLAPCGLSIEALEDRRVPSTLSVADVTVREGPTATGILDPGGAANVGISGMRDMAFNSHGDLFVGGYASGSVARFDWASQTYQPFVTPGEGGLADYSGVAFDPGGNVYVASSSQNEIFRYDPTGAPLPAPGQAGALYAQGGGLSGLGNIAFGPDGNLYAVSSTTNQILRYQGPSGSSPGAFMDVFVNNTINNPNRLTFGPDHELYVAGSAASGSSFAMISRYDGLTGQPVGSGIFVPTGSGGLHGTRQLIIDPQGTYLYVVEADSPGAVLRFQGPSGTTPGAYVDTYLDQGQAGLSIPIGVALDSAGNLYVSERDLNEVARFAPNSQASFAITLDTASTSQISVSYATANGTAVAGTDYTQTSGTVTFPAGVTSETVNVPITTVLTGGPTKAFALSLSGAVNATISRGQATGSILNRMTKFYVVDGILSPNSADMYHYGSGDTSEEVTPLLSNVIVPGGVATTAAGTTVWVVDENKNVYVFDNHGKLLGSWAAGGLLPNAHPTGIATNGTDIWLTDPISDKVYKYAGAASRLSGSQVAANSFSLVPGKKNNINPQDLVTDGTSFWVVDGSTLKVFKYTLSGSSLGSWSIDPANAYPTGITINPANVSDIWIVDSGTLKVYDYTNAASRTSGSQTAAAIFALASGDTSPQGIADPPPAAALLTPVTPPLALGPLSTAALTAVSVGDVAATPPLALRDAAFVLLTRQSLPGTSAVGVPADGALTPRPDSPAPAGPAAGQRPLDPVTLLSPWAGAGIRQEGSDLLDGPLADGTRPAAALATDGIAAGMEDAAATAP
jgi:sugar lactone lactonase YvrE